MRGHLPHPFEEPPAASADASQALGKARGHRVIGVEQPDGAGCAPGTHNLYVAATLTRPDGTSAVHLRCSACGAGLYVD